MSERLDLVARAAATARTLAKYRARPFDWRARSTCIHLARFHLRALGHRPPLIPDFRSAVGARRALAEQGAADVVALLDGQPGLARIAPAAMIVGDLAVMQPEEGADRALQSIVVSVGGKVLGWGEADPSGLRPIEAHAILAAWRT